MTTQLPELAEPSSAALVPGAKRMPAMVRNELARLPAQRQDEFLEEYRRKEKSTALAYVCWLVGCHYLYLGGRWGVTLLFWLTLGGLLVWWLIDGVRLWSVVREHNKDMAVDAPIGYAVS